MQTIVSMWQTGFAMPVAALTIARVCVGVFFVLSGYHKLFNASRHASLVNTLRADGIPLIGFHQWFVPCVEFAGGLGVMLGALAPLAAIGLFIVCGVATCVDGLGRIKDYAPLDKADWLDDLLYLPETLYLILLAIVIANGAGPISIDALAFRWLS